MFKIKIKKSEKNIDSQKNNSPSPRFLLEKSQP